MGWGSDTASRKSDRFVMESSVFSLTNNKMKACEELVIYRRTVI